MPPVVPGSAMRGFDFKLLLLVGLFAALVVKGGELCSAGGVQAMASLVESDKAVSTVNLPMKPIEEEFRGVSPVPALSDLATPVRKIDKPSTKASRKVTKPQASSKDAVRKTA